MLTLAPRNVWRLRLFLDLKYPKIIIRTKGAIADVGLRSAGESPKSGCVEVYSHWKHWICLFPQHGHGPKHLRRIRLDHWQEDLVTRHPGQFLAGLIHSDGCRCINRVKTYQYIRYFFSNRSADIRDLFVAACDSVGVSTRRNNRYDVSVARRESVAILDRMIGPKA